MGTMYLIANSDYCATKHVISPYTIRLAIAEYEKLKGLPQIGLGEVGEFMGAVMNFVKGCRTVSQVVFDHFSPEPKAYVAVVRLAFGSPFFESLKEFCKHEQGAEAFIHRVLGVSLADAKALAGELCQ